MAETPSNGNGFAQRYAVIIQTVTVVAIFAAGVWTVALSPLQTNLVGMQNQMSDLRVMVADVKAKMEINSRDIIEINRRHILDVVPRQESDANKAHTEQAIAMLADRLNELRNSTLKTVTVSDELKRLQADITELRERVADRK